MDTDLAVYVNSALEKRGWSQRELARRAGLSPTAISQIVNSDVEPKNNTLVRIALALDESPQDLLRLAGHLPAIPPPTDLDERVCQQFRVLGAEHKRAVAHIVAALAGQAVGERAWASTASRPEEGDRADELVEPSVEYDGSLGDDDYPVSSHRRFLARIVMDALKGREEELLRRAALYRQEQESPEEHTTNPEPGGK